MNTVEKMEETLKNLGFSFFKVKPSRHRSKIEQFLVLFPNNYGASIICGDDPLVKGSPSAPWELAVIECLDEEWGKFSDEYTNWDLCYDTPITDDVLGYLKEEEVVETLNKIRLLSRKPSLEFEFEA